MKISANTGEFNRRITIQKQEYSSDEIGYQSTELSDFYTCWAAVKKIRGREYWAAREQHEENTLSFKVRFCRKLSEINKTDYFIKYKNKIYNITDIDNIQEADSFLIISATERT